MWFIFLFEGKVRINAKKKNKVKQEVYPLPPVQTGLKVENGGF